MQSSIRHTLRALSQPPATKCAKSALAKLSADSEVKISYAYVNMMMKLSAVYIPRLLPVKVNV